MADYNTSIPFTGTTTANALDVPQEAHTPTVGGTPVDTSDGPPPIVTYYRLRGYRYLHVPPDFETWTDTSPDGTNPSEEPIMDVGVVTSWTV